MHRVRNTSQVPPLPVSGCITNTLDDRYTYPIDTLLMIPCRAVARSGISGVQRGSRPFAGAWGRPQSLFLPRPQGAKKLCNSPDELFGVDWVRLTNGSLILVNLYIMLAFLKSSGRRRNKQNVEQNCNV